MRGDGSKQAVLMTILQRFGTPGQCQHSSIYDRDMGRVCNALSQLIVTAHAIGDILTPVNIESALAIFLRRLPVPLKMRTPMAVEKAMLFRRIVVHHRHRGNSSSRPDYGA
jgi:hypothetical protein